MSLFGAEEGADGAATSAQGLWDTASSQQESLNLEALVGEGGLFDSEPLIPSMVPQTHVLHQQSSRSLFDIEFGDVEPAAVATPPPLPPLAAVDDGDGEVGSTGSADEDEVEVEAARAPVHSSSSTPRPTSMVLGGSALEELRNVVSESNDLFDALEHGDYPEDLAAEAAQQVEAADEAIAAAERAAAEREAAEAGSPSSEEHNWQAASAKKKKKKKTDIFDSLDSSEDDSAHFTLASDAGLDFTDLSSPTLLRHIKELRAKVSKLEATLTTRDDLISTLREENAHLRAQNRKLKIRSGSSDLSFMEDPLAVNPVRRSSAASVSSPDVVSVVHSGPHPLSRMTPASALGAGSGQADMFLPKDYSEEKSGNDALFQDSQGSSDKHELDRSWVKAGGPTFLRSKGTVAGSRLVADSGKTPRRASELLSMFTVSQSEGASNPGTSTSLFAGVADVSSEHHEPRTPAIAPSDPAETKEQFDSFMATPDADKLKKAVLQFLRRTKAALADGSVDPEEAGSSLRDFMEGAVNFLCDRDMFRNADEAVFDYARDHLEKKIMTHLHPLVFKGTPEEQAEDRAFHRRCRCLRFLTASDLDVPAGCNNEMVFNLAKDELARMNSHLIPEAKLECIVACADILFRSLNLSRGDSTRPGADEFLPVFIYVVLQANVKHVLANSRYIERFRSSSGLMSKSGYCFANFQLALAFLRELDHSRVTGMDQETFEMRFAEKEAELEEGA